MTCPFIPFQELLWSSDWNGDEVGYDHLPVVGLYTWKDKGIDMYIDMETMRILEIWSTEEDEE
jgi:hypothetical protein